MNVPWGQWGQDTGIGPAPPGGLTFTPTTSTAVYPGYTTSTELDVAAGGDVATDPGVYAPPVDTSTATATDTGTEVLTLPEYDPATGTISPAPTIETIPETYTAETIPAAWSQVGYAPLGTGTGRVPAPRPLDIARRDRAARARQRKQPPSVAPSRTPNFLALAIGAAALLGGGALIGRWWAGRNTMAVRR